MRTDENFYLRRNGINYIRQELKYLKYSYENGLLNFWHIILQILFKTSFRILPVNSYKYLINLIRKI